MSNSDKIKCKTLFISDLHLGTKGFQHERFIKFLSQYEFEKIYIIGDFIDIWQLRRKSYWPQEHTTVVRKLLKRSSNTKIIFIIGNHDEFCENFFGSFGNITICDRDDHYINGKKYLVIHGHQFDYVTRHTKWLSMLGSVLYSWLLSLNLFIDKLRRRCGFHSHWSFSSFVKKNVKNAVSHIFNFEKSLSLFAQKHGYDGVLAGHIHTAANLNLNGIHYINTGDWVESCTAVIEDYDGNVSSLECWD